MKRITESPKKKPIDKPAPLKPTAPVVNNDIQSKLAKAQIEATIAMTEVAANAINNPQLTHLIQLLSQPKEEVSGGRKRLHVYRDEKGLIESIEIEEMQNGNSRRLDS